MIPLGTLSTLYLVSMLVGGAFIGINLFMGNLGEGTDDGGGGGGGDDFAGGGGDGGGGHDFGASDSGGSGDGGSGGDGSGGDDLGGSNTGGRLLTPSIARATFFGAAHHTGPVSMHSAPIIPRLSARVGSFILGLLSPMALAMFMTFFGAFGLLFQHLTPWLGVFTLVPALLISMAISNVFKYAVRWLIVHGNVSTEAKADESIGQVGEIITPIKEGRAGEVVYVVGSKRYHSTAKPNKEGIEFKRGTKVLITGIQDHVVFVDECSQLDFQ